MTRRDVQFFRRWFGEFCKSYSTSDPVDRKNYNLKEYHTAKVCKNIVDIGTGLLLDEQKLMLSETIALFHDVGRFPQYAQYRTFRDNQSVNHGFLGARVLRERKILACVSKREQDLIMKTIRFHNAFSVFKTEDEELDFFIRLIRDADKLDIWRVFKDYYVSPAQRRASAAGLGLADMPDYSKSVVSTIYQGKIVSLSKIKTLNDFKLLQLSWIFDLNFKQTFALVTQRNIIDDITKTLPDTDDIREVVQFVRNYVKQNVGRDSV
jgi:hypothetical protein